MNVGRPARASGLTDAWSGASATATFFDKSDSHQGAIAGASVSGSQVLTYAGNTPGTTYQATVSGRLSGSAEDSAAQLLHVSASGSTPDPGVIGGPWPQGQGAATAAWTSDSAVVTAAPLSSLPDTIRLNFGLTYTVPGGGGGPGEYLPDPTEGITRVEDLPQAKTRQRSRDYRWRPCPRCGHSSYRDRVFQRTLHDLGDLNAGRPCDVVWERPPTRWSAGTGGIGRCRRRSTG